MGGTERRARDGGGVVTCVACGSTTDNPATVRRRTGTRTSNRTVSLCSDCWGDMSPPSCAACDDTHDPGDMVLVETAGTDASFRICTGCTDEWGVPV